MIAPSEKLLNGTADGKIEKKELRDVNDIIGQYGPWQRLIFILICLRGIPTAFFNLSTPFFAPQYDVWCARPRNVLQNMSSEEWRNMSIPRIDDGGISKYSRCFMYEVTISGSGEVSVNTTKTLACSRWEYDNSFYTMTIIEEYNLVCGRDWMISFTQFIYMMGMMVGVFLSGHLADKFGRQIILQLSVTLMVVSGIATAFSPNFIMFSTCRFILAVGVAGVQNSSFCLLMEILGPGYRTRVTFAFSFGWAFGLLLLPGMAYLIRDWKYLQLVSTLLSSVLLCYWCIMPESPRWLITQSRYEEAEQIMLIAAEKNNIVADDLPLLMEELKERIEIEKKTTTPNVIDLFRTSNLRKNTIFVYVTYFSIAFVFYGLSLAQTNLGGNPFVNFFIGSSLEIPAYILCIIFIRYLRRRSSLFIFNAVGALACFFIIPSSPEYFWLRLTSAMIGKLCISGAFVIIAIHAAEIFPTIIRTVGAGTSLMMGRIGAMTAPFVKEIGNATYEFVPPVVFGSLSILAAVLVLLLPETYNQTLPDTIREAENVGKEKKSNTKMILPEYAV